MSGEVPETKPEQTDADSRTWAQRAAANDMAFGNLPEHMADYYDNEHRSEMRSREASQRQN